MYSSEGIGSLIYMKNKKSLMCYLFLGHQQNPLEVVEALGQNCFWERTRQEIKAKI